MSGTHGSEGAPVGKPAGATRRVLGSRYRAVASGGRAGRVIAAAAYQIDCGALARLAEQHHREGTDR